MCLKVKLFVLAILSVASIALGHDLVPEDQSNSKSDQDRSDVIERLDAERRADPILSGPTGPVPYPLDKMEPLTPVGRLESTSTLATRLKHPEADGPYSVFYKKNANSKDDWQYTEQTFSTKEAADRAAREFRDRIGDHAVAYPRKVDPDRWKKDRVTVVDEIKKELKSKKLEWVEPKWVDDPLSARSKASYDTERKAFQEKVNRPFDKQTQDWLDNLGKKNISGSDASSRSKEKDSGTNDPANWRDAATRITGKWTGSTGGLGMVYEFGADGNASLLIQNPYHPIRKYGTWSLNGESVTIRFQDTGRPGTSGFSAGRTVTGQITSGGDLTLDGNSLRRR